MTLKFNSILLFIIAILHVNVKSQNRKFIVGAIIGFYGIHIEGDVENLYSSSNGTF